MVPRSWLSFSHGGLQLLKPGRAVPNTILFIYSQHFFSSGKILKLSTWSTENPFPVFRKSEWSSPLLLTPVELWVCLSCGGWIDRQNCFGPAFPPVTYCSRFRFSHVIQIELNGFLKTSTAGKQHLAECSTVAILKFLTILLLNLCLVIEV